MHSPLQPVTRVEGETLHLDWQFEGRRVAASDLRDLELVWPAGARMATLAGRAPLWLYAAATLSAADAGLAVATLYPQCSGYVCVVGDGTGLRPGQVRRQAGGQWRTPGGAPARSPRWRVSGDGDPLVLGWDGPPEQVESAVLEHVDRAVEAAIEGRRPRLVCWDGSAPVWLVSAVAHAVRRQCPGAAIAVSSMTDGGEVVVRTGADGAYPPGLVLRSPAATRTAATVYGIVGDPNSGKSVLSWKLYRAIQRLGRRVYRLDCDVRAPTAPWGLASELGERLRKSQKIAWDEQIHVPLLLQALEGMEAAALDVGLADLPGGIHRPEQVQRVPAGREPLFRAIDRYIVVQRSDAIARAWWNDIKAVHPEAMVAAEVRSRLDPPPAGHPMHDGHGWHTQPLLRETLNEQDPAVEALAKELLGS